MTEQEAREALLVYLKTQDHRYLSPKLLMPVTGWSPMQYPVVTAHDEHTGNLCFSPVWSTRMRWAGHSTGSTGWPITAWRR